MYSSIISGEFSQDQVATSITVNHERLPDGQQEVSGVVLLVHQLSYRYESAAILELRISIPETIDLAKRLCRLAGVEFPSVGT